MTAPAEAVDYVIVGSGAGGGPLAVRLAAAGHRVVVLEAGGSAGGLAYDVPAFHAHAAEDPRLRWDFWVKHYDDPQARARDPKYVTERDGVLYPRAATVGGCTAHNAMITVYPNDQDWDALAASTGDPSWRAEAMRPYFERLERCGYRWQPWPWLGRGITGAILRRIPLLRRWVTGSGHGFRGWLPTALARPTLLARDKQLLKVVAAAAEAQLAETLDRPLTAVERLGTWLDPNDAAVQKDGPLGVWLIPLATLRGRRRGTREPLEEAAADGTGRLRLLTNCLATRLVLDADGRCTGVEYRRGAHLYRADPAASADVPPQGTVHTITAAREVIVAAGTFNTPQLLKLSGIGPAAELREHGIDVRVDLPGVGGNLQDRYEVSVVTAVDRDFDLVRGGAFRPPRQGDPADPYLLRWQDGKGPYTTNGGLLGVVAASSPELTVPDLFLFALPASFRGYYPGYAADLQLRPNKLTWVVLKAHTENRAGTVTLTSADPCDPPEIRFRYFDEGSDARGRDLDAVVAGVRLARRLTERLDGIGAREVLPGPAAQGDEELRRYVRDHAWGHHACGTCAIGPDSDPNAVLDSEFRVRGVPGLRVVDASIFPRIPGYFIATAIYLASEKAADVILAAADRRADQPATAGKGAAHR